MSGVLLKFLYFTFDHETGLFKESRENMHFYTVKNKPWEFYSTLLSTQFEETTWRWKDSFVIRDVVSFVYPVKIFPSLVKHEDFTIYYMTFQTRNPVWKNRVTFLDLFLSKMLLSKNVYRIFWWLFIVHHSTDTTVCDFQVSMLLKKRHQTYMIL